MFVMDWLVQRMLFCDLIMQHLCWDLRKTRGFKYRLTKICLDTLYFYYSYLSLFYGEKVKRSAPSLIGALFVSLYWQNSFSPSIPNKSIEIQFQIAHLVFNSFWVFKMNSIRKSIESTAIIMLNRHSLFFQNKQQSFVSEWTEGDCGALKICISGLFFMGAQNAHTSLAFVFASNEFPALRLLTFCRPPFSDCRQIIF